MSIKDEQCFQVPELSKEEHIALKALYVGAANEYEQRLALTVIVNKFARAHDVLYIPGSPDQSAFLSGRAFVGQRILRCLKIPVGRLKTIGEDNNET